MSDFNYANFIESIPSLFATAIQKATLSSFLWNSQDPQTIIYNLRLYDIVRRLFYVKTGRDATDEEILHLIDIVKQNEKMMDFFMVYIKKGEFPPNDIIRMIHDEN